MPNFAVLLAFSRPRTQRRYAPKGGAAAGMATTTQSTRMPGLNTRLTRVVLTANRAAQMWSPTTTTRGAATRTRTRESRTQERNESAPTPLELRSGRPGGRSKFDARTTWSRCRRIASRRPPGSSPPAPHHPRAFRLALLPRASRAARLAKRPAQSQTRVARRRLGLPPRRPHRAEHAHAHARAAATATTAIGRRAYLSHCPSIDRPTDGAGLTDPPADACDARRAPERPAERADKHTDPPTDRPTHPPTHRPTQFQTLNTQPPTDSLDPPSSCSSAGRLQSPSPPPTCTLP